jgi:hypothetical protein
MKAAGRGIHIGIWLLWLILLLVKPVQAAEGFRPFTEVIPTAEGYKSTRCVWMENGKKFSFIPPNRWSVKVDGAKKTIHLVPQDLKAGLTLRIVPEPAEAVPELNPEALRERILEKYPGAILTHEFACAAGGRSGLAFELERVVQGDTRAAGRIAFVPYEGGMLELELVTPAGKLDDYHIRFSRMLSSFRIEPTPRP